MKKMEKGELYAYQTRAQSFLTTAEFSRLATTLRRHMSSVQFFSDPYAQFAREMWVAARFAIAIGANRVRLLEDDWPDFEIESDNHVDQFEVTEVDLPGRHRGDEYKAVAAGQKPRISDDPVEAWIARADLIPNALQSAALRKGTKGYPPTANLVIYLNIDEWDIRHNEIIASFASQTKPAAAAFRQVWVLWKSTLYLVWENGQTKEGHTHLTRIGH